MLEDKFNKQEKIISQKAGRKGNSNVYRGVCVAVF